MVLHCPLQNTVSVDQLCLYTELLMCPKTDGDETSDEITRMIPTQLFMK